MSCTARTYGCGFVLGLGFWDGGLGLAVLLPTCFSLAVLPRDRETEGERERETPFLADNPNRLHATQTRIKF